MNLVAGFFKQRDLSPQQISFIEGEKQLSYEQFHDSFALISSHLINNQCFGQRIAVALDRGINAAAAIYGILSAGACYIPLDIKNPPNRLRYIINDAQPGLVLGLGPCPEWLDKPELWFDLKQLQPCQNSQSDYMDMNPESLAAILYTSGSTGQPKGVALSHRAMLNFTVWALTTFHLSSIDRIANLAPFHFDLSVFDLFSSLYAGATVHFMPTSLTLSPVKLTAWLAQHGISCWYTVPSLLAFIALKGALVDTHLANLRNILFAGEVFPTKHLLRLTEQLPAVEFFNLYGPTETNVCTYWPVKRSQLFANEAIPIGIAACGADLKIDSDSGELLVQSHNNFSGYWHNGRLDDSEVKSGWYATGDKVSINERGEYCYHGRLDRMLKCSGYRVEPAEIEAIINQIPGVEHCAVIGLNDSASGQRPAAAVILKKGTHLNDIIKPLKEKLPTYMVPVKFITLSTIPTLSNGKTDYQTLGNFFNNNQLIKIADEWKIFGVD
jgi:amino acid adenylation domain-containing protein